MSTSTDDNGRLGDTKLSMTQLVNHPGSEWEHNPVKGGYVLRIEIEDPSTPGLIATSIGHALGNITLEERKPTPLSSVDRLRLSDEALDAVRREEDERRRNPGMRSYGLSPKSRGNSDGTQISPLGVTINHMGNRAVVEITIAENDFIRKASKHLDPERRAEFPELEDPHTAAAAATRGAGAGTVPRGSGSRR